MKNSTSQILTILLVPILLLLSLRFGFGFDGLYGQDAYAYLDQSYHIFDLDKKWFQASFYPLLGNIFSLGLIQKVWILQFISALSISISALVLSNILQRNKKQKTIGWLVLLFFVLAPFVLRSSALVMSDSLAILWITLCLDQLIKKSQASVFYLFLFASFAILTRFAVLPIVSVFLVYKLVIAFKKRHIIPLLFGALVSIGLLLFFFTKFTSIDGGIGHGAISEWDIFNLFRSSFQTENGVLNYGLPNLIHVLKIFWHPGLVWVSLLVVFNWTAFKTRVKQNKTLSISILLYLLFIGGLASQNNRFLLPLAPLVLYLVLPVVMNIIESFSTIVFRKIAGVVLAIGLLGLSFYSIQPFVKRSITEQKIATYLQQRENSIHSIYTVDLTPSLKVRGVKEDLHELWGEEKIIFRNYGMVIVDTLAIENQWKNSVPFRNWETLNRYYSLQLETQIDNYTFYRIGKKR